MSPGQILHTLAHVRLRFQFKARSRAELSSYLAMSCECAMNHNNLTFLVSRRRKTVVDSEISLWRGDCRRIAALVPSTPRDGAGGLHPTEYFRLPYYALLLILEMTRLQGLLILPYRDSPGESTLTSAPRKRRSFPTRSTKMDKVTWSSTMFPPCNATLNRFRRLAHPADKGREHRQKVFVKTSICGIPSSVRFRPTESP
jgi:hypothetical protein